MWHRDSVQEMGDASLGARPRSICSLSQSESPSAAASPGSMGLGAVTTRLWSLRRPLEIPVTRREFNGYRP
eukprot:48745-Hanusia_phi.AAC.1